MEFLCCSVNLEERDVQASGGISGCKFLLMGKHMQTCVLLRELPPKNLLSRGMLCYGMIFYREKYALCATMLLKRCQKRVYRAMHMKRLRSTLTTQGEELTNLVLKLQRSRQEERAVCWCVSKSESEMLPSAQSPSRLRKKQLTSLGAYLHSAMTMLVQESDKLHFRWESFWMSDCKVLS